MPTARMRRVNEVIREVLAAAIATELKDPRIGFVTVTDVDTSPDLRAARVFVSVLGNESERDAALEGLRSAHGFLQGKLASEVRLKRTPTTDLPVRRERGTRYQAFGTARRMTNAVQMVKSDLDRVVEEIREGQRFLLTTHENPDGDALGSLLAMHQVLEAMGKDSIMFLAAKEFPLPVEYRFMPLEEVFHEPPADMADRVVIFLDCGNIDRMPVDFLKNDGEKVLNIDHHHDNTRFGTVNLVDVDASSTAEIVFDLIGLLGVDLTPEVAMALYVGLVTDTGKFMYENTDARSHRMAAALVDAGVNVNEIYRRLYEHVPVEKLRLVARALEKIELHDNGRIAVTYISKHDYEVTGASEVLTEGIIDHLRTLDGTVVAAVVRDQPERGRAGRKVSLRSTDGRVDVSAIAREQGGGGHQRAAGFGTDLSYDEVVEFLRAQVGAQL